MFETDDEVNDIREYKKRTELPSHKDNDAEYHKKYYQLFGRKNQSNYYKKRNRKRNPTLESTDPLSVAITRPVEDILPRKKTGIPYKSSDPRYKKAYNELMRVEKSKAMREYRKKQMENNEC